MQISAQKSYRNVLAIELEHRISKKSNYSLRAFARDLKVPISSLSAILAGKQGVSAAKAQELAKRIGLNTEETLWFVLNAQSMHERKKKTRALAQAKIRLQGKLPLLSHHQFEPLKWSDLAILEMTSLKNFKNDPIWMGKRIGISPEGVKIAINRLLEQGHLIEANGTLRATEQTGFQTSSPVPSSAIREFHTHILNRAEGALHTQDLEEREFGAAIFTMDAEDMAWAKSEMRAFRTRLSTRLDSKPNKNRLYCLSMQLFNLLEGETK